MEEKFIALIQNHQGIIHKVLGLYVDNAEDKKDMHQEILLQAWKSYGNFKGNSKFSTWLYKVCLNTALTYRKKEDKRSVVTSGVVGQTEGLITPTQNDQHEILYLIIKNLNEVDRMLITLHLDGYKNQEIATITGITANHVNVKIHRLKANIIEQSKKVADGHI